MSVFVAPFDPIHKAINVVYPVTETQISAREVENDGSMKPSRELTVESIIYDNRGQIVNNQTYSMEIWA